jgi:citrate lyase beta subunit
MENYAFPTPYYMPGDDRRKIEKATTLGVDCICMDMEDGVAITRKTEARAVIAQAMKELDFGNGRHSHQYRLD